MVELKKRWLIWVISALLAFSAGLLANFPASIAYEAVRMQLPSQLTKLIGDVDGSVWNGQSTVTDEILSSTINWELKPVDRLFGGYGLILHIHDVDHDLRVKFDPEGNNNGRLQISGTISKELLNRQLAQFGVKVDQGIVIDSVVASLRDSQFSDVGGSVLWKGGRVSYTSSGTKTVQMPELKGLLSSAGDTLNLEVVKSGSSKPISIVTFQSNGWIGVEVKQEMGSLIMLPNRRVNRAGNVMEIKRKIY